MLSDVYREYGGYFYLPMTQAYSLAVPVTIGCSWNKCLYCDLNHMNEFSFLGLKEIENRLKILKDHYSARKRNVEKIVMAGANPLCLNTRILLDIIDLIKRYFPHVKNISSFSRVDDILRKSREELLELKRAGMGELVIGIESGNDQVLRLHDKGVTNSENIKALSILEECNITYSTYIMIGLGGRELSKENAIDTGKLLSRFNPQVIIAVTLVLFKDARLVEKVRNREFVRLKSLESLMEERLLLENLNMKDSIFNGTHKTNVLIVKGKLPDQKDMLIEKIDKALEGYNDRQIKSKEQNKWKIWSVE